MKDFRNLHRPTEEIDPNRLANTTTSSIASHNVFAPDNVLFASDNICELRFHSLVRLCEGLKLETKMAINELLSLNSGLQPCL